MMQKQNINKVAAVIIMSLTISSCVRFGNRTQAEGTFNYQATTLNEDYKTGDFSRDEQRTTYKIQPLTEQQEAIGLRAENVDIRPPTQLIPVLEGVLLDPDPTQTKVIINSFKQNDNTEQKAWDLIIEYLLLNNVTPLKADPSLMSLETGPFVIQRQYGSWGPNIVKDEAAYNLQIEKGRDGRSISILVDVQSFEQTNDGVSVTQILEGRTKRGIEINFINDLLSFAYDKRESEALKALDDKPLPIKLGFDDNHQTAWLIDTEFLDAWRKLPDLLKLMSFEIVESDKNLGYFLVEFKPQDIKYWLEHSINPINLEKAEYFVQLGELTGGETSLVWLDEDKKPLPDQQVTDLYLSISESIRSVIIESDIQTKQL